MQLILVLLAVSGAAFSLPQHNEYLKFDSQKSNWSNVLAQDYNYFASIHQVINDMGIITDTGIIINNRWILTGALYIDKIYPKDITVRVGSSSSSEGKGLKISKVVPHPKYNSSVPETSLALLRLEEELQLSKTVGVAPLGTTQPKYDDNVAIVGFGMSEDTEASLPLKKLELVSCSHYFEGYYLLCTKKPAIGPTQTDYGVALIHKEKVLGLFTGDYYADSFWSDTMTLYVDISEDLISTWIKNTVNEVNTN